MNEKILILGDIHGRDCWKNIIEYEQPSLTVFLGDYVSTHEEITSNEQIYNLLDILNYKEKNPGEVILLRGNHDMQHLGYYWAECSGLDNKVLNWMCREEIKNRFINNSQWILIKDKYILSHAGVSEDWLKHYYIDFNNINNMPPDFQFGFTPNNRYDFYGVSPTQPLTWIRPQTLIKCAYGDYHQIVGHTRVQYDYAPITMNNGCNLYLCDCLPDSYIIMDNINSKYNITYKKWLEKNG